MVDSLALQPALAEEDIIKDDTNAPAQVSSTIWAEYRQSIQKHYLQEDQSQDQLLDWLASKGVKASKRQLTFQLKKWKFFKKRSYLRPQAITRSIPNSKAQVGNILHEDQTGDNSAPVSQLKTTLLSVNTMVTSSQTIAQTSSDAKFHGSSIVLDSPAMTEAVDHTFQRCRTTKYGRENRLSEDCVTENFGQLQEHSVQRTDSDFMLTTDPSAINYMHEPATELFTGHVDLPAPPLCECFINSSTSIDTPLEAETGASIVAPSMASSIEWRENSSIWSVFCPIHGMPIGGANVCPFCHILELHSCDLEVPARQLSIIKSFKIAKGHGFLSFVTEAPLASAAAWSHWYNIGKPYTIVHHVDLVNNAVQIIQPGEKALVCALTVLKTTCIREACYSFAALFATTVWQQFFDTLKEPAKASFDRHWKAACKRCLCDHLFGDMASIGGMKKHPEAIRLELTAEKAGEYEQITLVSNLHISNGEIFDMESDSHDEFEDLFRQHLRATCIYSPNFTIHSLKDIDKYRLDPNQPSTSVGLIDTLIMMSTVFCVTSLEIIKGSVLDICRRTFTLHVREAIDGSEKQRKKSKPTSRDTSNAQFFADLLAQTLGMLVTLLRLTNRAISFSCRSCHQLQLQYQGLSRTEKREGGQWLNCHKFMAQCLNQVSFSDLDNADDEHEHQFEDKLRVFEFLDSRRRFAQFKDMALDRTLRSQLMAFTYWRRKRGAKENDEPSPANFCLQQGAESVSKVIRVVEPRISVEQHETVFPCSLKNADGPELDVQNPAESQSPKEALTALPDKVAPLHGASVAVREPKLQVNPSDQTNEASAHAYKTTSGSVLGPHMSREGGGPLSFVCSSPRRIRRPSAYDSGFDRALTYSARSSRASDLCSLCSSKHRLMARPAGNSGTSSFVSFDPFDMSSSRHFPEHGISDPYGVRYASHDECHLPRGRYAQTPHRNSYCDDENDSMLAESLSMMSLGWNRSQRSQLMEIPNTHKCRVPTRSGIESREYSRGYSQRQYPQRHRPRINSQY